jgi:hypothetical protein
MVHTLVIIVLAVAAIYCGGFWLYMAVANAVGRFNRFDDAQRDRLELYTFHLGLCCIIACGFLGLIA